MQQRRLADVHNRNLADGRDACAVPVKVASIEPADDGAQTIQVTATPGSGETGGTVAATLYFSHLADLRPDGEHPAARQ